MHLRHFGFGTALCAIFLLAACAREAGDPVATAKDQGLQDLHALPGEAVALATKPGVEWSVSAGDLATDGRTIYAVVPAAAGAFTATARSGSEESLTTRIVVSKPAYGPFRFARTSDDTISITNDVLTVEAGAATAKGRQGFARIVAGDEEWLAEVSPDEGHLSRGTVVIPAHGDLDREAALALDALAHSAVFTSMVYAALDLACAPEAERLPPAASAAVLLPLQLVMKHRLVRRHAAFEFYAASSACRYVAADPGDQRRPPNPVLVSLPAESVIPSAFGFFPLDDVGALALRRTDRAAGQASGDEP